MATIRTLSMYKFLELRPISEDWEFQSGRIAAVNPRARQIPETVNISETDATHEMVLNGLSGPHYVALLSNTNYGGEFKFDPDPAVKHAFVINLKSAKGLPVNPHSRIIGYDGQWYYIYTWTKLFGAPVKQAMLHKTRNYKCVIFLEAASPEHNAAIQALFEEYRKGEQ